MARPKSLGSYAPLSATYHRDDAVLEAGEKAELLFVRGLAFCSEAMSDGFISDRQVVAVVGAGMRDATKRAAVLVGVGLWDRVDGGYVVRSWLKWNKSAEEIGRARKQDRDRKATVRPLFGRAQGDGFHASFRRDSRRNAYRNPGQIPAGIRPEYSRARGRAPESLHITTKHFTSQHFRCGHQVQDRYQSDARRRDDSWPWRRPLMASQVELERLAGAVAKLRPEWTARSVRTYLETHHADRAFADLAVALVAVAVDPKTKTPARVAEHGPWWVAAYVASTDGTPAPRQPECVLHPGQPAGRCPDCERTAVPSPGLRALVREHLRAVREAS